MQKPMGAQVSHALKARGVDVIFGIPGVHNVEMYRGIEEAGITHVLARHEQGAAFMADGYARATGKPGVCYLITGPGFLNATTALGQAYSDSVPVLALASCLDETSARRGQLHQMRDQAGAGRTVCDWSEEVSEPGAVYQLLDRALAEFSSKRPRPKAMHMPIKALGAPAMAAPEPAAQLPRPQASEAQVRQVVDAVLAADKPLFIFGGGAVGAGVAATEVLRMTGAASFVTYAGRGIVPPKTPLFFGSYLARGDSIPVLNQADLVVVLGSELAEVDLWRDELGYLGRMIRVDLDPEILAQGDPDDLRILGDAPALLQAMAVSIPARTEDRAACWDAAFVDQKRALWRTEVIAERPGIVEVAEALRAVMPEDAMIYSDMTQFAYAAKEVWDMPRAGHWHHPTGFGTLGYALPAGIGGAAARPGLPTVVIAGDYGLQYTLPELGAAVELGLPMPILIWDNGELAEIKDAMVESQIAPNAVVARNPDFLALAKAYGAGAVQPGSLEELQSALLAAFRADGPTVIRMVPGLI
ncbi:MAG: thiamine pyrophosphate-binding protein [Pelagimonas sp.]|jgi:acetolactate synthase-1/2/3 large subunit/5-guanidino-2-oxopentanoate decarboxylase|nr:thiamine pyrophosphate-binding protein [Pelagimonas sp.]